MIRLTCPCGAEFERLETESHLHDDQHRELCLSCAKVEAKKPRRNTMAKSKSGEAKSKPTRKRARQSELPGMERPRFPEIERAAAVYADLREQRKDLAERETSARAVLILAMRRHGQTAYRDDNADPPIVITLEAKDAVKLVEVRPEKRTDLERDMAAYERDGMKLGEKSAALDGTAA